jgi:hypothetical protein
MSSPKPIFLTKFNERTDNPGDMLIFDCLLNLLQQYGSIYCLMEVPWSKHKPENLSRKDLLCLGLRCVWSRIMQRPIPLYLVYPPGAVVRKWYSVSREVPIDWVKKTIKDFLWRLAGRRAILMGASCYDPSFLQDFGISILGLRDDSSLGAFSESANCKVLYCPDLSLTANSSEVSKNGLETFLSFRKFDAGNSESKIDECDLEERLRQLLQVLDSTGARIHFFNQVEEDEGYNKHLSQRLSDGSANWMLGPNYENFQQFYLPASFVVSNRLHVLLVGALAGAIPVAFVSKSHTKVISAYRKLGWEQLVIPIESRNITRQLEDILENKFELRDLVRKTIHRERAIAQRLFEDIFNSQTSP